ncbi:MAG TPA: hypothetical protein VFN61_11195 [Acidimicrobiales bacterium]|nr:hypothetical protein [Acidimicrobiales bacterium]
MHPLEQLRYLARSWGAGDELPVQEAASVLAELADISPGALLQACRRLIEYFPGSGRAWWLSARALSAPEPVEGIWDAAAELDADPTFEHLARELPVGRPVALVHAPRALSLAVARRAGVSVQKKPRGASVVVVVAQAAGPEHALLSPRAVEAVSMARSHDAEIWCAVPRGALLPGPLWAQLQLRAGQEVPQLLSADRASTAVGEAGAGPMTAVLAGPTCPPVAELLAWRA